MWLRYLMMLLCLTGFSFSVAGCDDDNSAEEVGEEIDDAAEEAADDVEDAVD